MAAEKNILLFIELAILPGRFPAFDVLETSKFDRLIGMLSVDQK